MKWHSSLPINGFSKWMSGRIKCEQTFLPLLTNCRLSFSNLSRSKTTAMPSPTYFSLHPICWDSSFNMHHWSPVEKKKISCFFKDLANFLFPQWLFHSLLSGNPVKRDLVMRNLSHGHGHLMYCDNVLYLVLLCNLLHLRCLRELWWRTNKNSRAQLPNKQQISNNVIYD